MSNEILEENLEDRQVEDALLRVELSAEGNAQLRMTRGRTWCCNRRQFVTAAGAALMAPLCALAEESQTWEVLVKKLLGAAKPAEVKTMLEMPEIAENGNTVPFTVSLNSPMTDEEYVKAIHIIATANPQPGVASFHFTPQSGKAAVSSRARLARTQDVIAIGELSDGTFVMSKRTVKVTIGGCGG